MEIYAPYLGNTFGKDIEGKKRHCAQSVVISTLCHCELRVTIS